MQFNGTVFKQILGIPMGGNASPFIADLYLSWCEYCYVTKLTKTDYNLAKRLSYNCRYLDDICTVNLKDFDTISKDIYDNTLILEGSTCSYKRDNFLDLYIRVIDGKFVTGVYHKVDDFNFEVISYPFPDSNIHSSLGYSTFYSQLIRFHRLCNNKSDFLFRAKLICQKLINRGYKFNLLQKSFMRFTNKYPVEIKYGVQRHDNLFLQMLSFDNYVICNINRDDVNTIVSPCCVKIENIAKLPLHKQNKLILPLSQKSQTRTQSEVMLPLSQQASGEKAGVSNHEAYHSGNLPHIPKLTSSSHVHPFGIKNPKNHCFINVILQFIYIVLRFTQQKIHINNCVEGKISECLFDTAHKTPSAQEVETLKLQLSTYNSFFTGEIQEDACECHMLLIEIMDKGFGPCPTNDNINSKGSFSELLFSFVLGKYTICHICTMKSPAFETTSLLYVTPTDSSSMQELLMQEHKQKLYKTCSCCGRDTWHIESKKFLQPPNYLIIIVNRYTYSNNRITKNKSRIPLDLYIKLGPYKFSLQASVDHHGYCMNSGHYTASISCCGKTLTVTIIKLPNVISRILIIHLLPIYFCTSSCYIRAAICLKGRLSLLALSSVYSLTVEDGSWSTPMVPAQLSVPL